MRAMTVRLPDELADDLEKAAYVNRESRAETIRKAVRNYVDWHQSEYSGHLRKETGNG